MSENQYSGLAMLAIVALVAAVAVVSLTGSSIKANEHKCEGLANAANNIVNLADSPACPHLAELAAEASCNFVISCGIVTPDCSNNSDQPVCSDTQTKVCVVCDINTYPKCQDGDKWVCQ